MHRLALLCGAVNNNLSNIKRKNLRNAENRTLLLGEKKVCYLCAMQPPN